MGLLVLGPPEEFQVQQAPPGEPLFSPSRNQSILRSSQPEFHLKDALEQQAGLAPLEWKAWAVPLEEPQRVLQESLGGSILEESRMASHQEWLGLLEALSRVRLQHLELTEGLGEFLAVVFRGRQHQAALQGEWVRQWASIPGLSRAEPWR